MKYIKTYEKSWLSDPQIGEYYLIKDWYLKYFIEIFDSPYIKIVDIKYYSNNKYIGITTNNKRLSFNEDMFERKLTPEEINQYEMALNANKYNL